MTSLREHIKTLEIREAEFKKLKAALAEAKAGGGNVNEVGARLAAAKAAYENIYGIVEMEKTIKGLWVPATQAYKRVEAQVNALTSQIEMLGGQ